MSLDSNEQIDDPLDREVLRPDGATYNIRAVRAGEPLRDYGDTGSIVDLLAMLIQVVSFGFRRWTKPGWTIGVFLWRKRRLPRLVHKERLPRDAAPAERVTEICHELASGWRPIAPRVLPGAIRPVNTVPGSMIPAAAVVAALLSPVLAATARTGPPASVTGSVDQPFDYGPPRTRS